MRYRKIAGLLLVMLLPVLVQAQTPANADDLFYKLRNRLDAVKDYVADVKLKIDVSFMRVPQLNGKLYYKAPDKMKLERNGGISILPKRTTNLSISSMIPTGKATVIDAGYDASSGKKLRVLKIVPENDGTDIVLTKIWVDEERLLAMRTETTTRDNGTVKMELVFDKYVAQALPDKVTFFLDVKEYKIPKGVTMDYDGANERVKKQDDGKRKKGKIEIFYLNYKLNQGLPDSVFDEKKK